MMFAYGRDNSPALPDRDDDDVRAALERTEAAAKLAAASNVVVLNRAAR